MPKTPQVNGSATDCITSNWAVIPVKTHPNPRIIHSPNTTENAASHPTMITIGHYIKKKLHPTVSL